MAWKNYLFNRLQKSSKTAARTQKRTLAEIRKGRLFVEPLEDRVVPSTVTQWTFENNTIAVNNSPTPSTGTGTASGLGMTNSYNGTTSTNTDDVTQGATGDTGSNGLADTTQIWRIRGQSPGNGWSSQAPIGTQGAEFAASTVGYNSINVSFDFYATTQGEGKLQLEYTTDGTTWTNVPVTVPGADTNVAALTNSSSPNTVMGSYVQISGGQQWAPNLTATITDPNANNNPSFAIELVNASTGADCVNTSGAALNNSSGNWRFDNITISGTPVVANDSTSTAINSISPTTSTFGSPVAFSATVTDTSDSAPPTAGSVQFKDTTSGTVLATATTNTTSTNTTTFTVTSSSVPPGQYTSVEAFYIPGTGFNASNSAAFGSNVTVNQAPSITSPSSTTFNAGANNSFTVTATGYPTAITYAETGTLPAGVTFNTGTGVLSGVPTQAGSFPLSFTATNSAGTGPAQGFTLTVIAVPLAPSFALAQWSFENNTIAVNNSPTPSLGTGTASGLGMTNSYNGTTSTNTDDVTQGVAGDTGSNGLADTTQTWRVRGQSPGNGWSSQAPIGTQGAEFATSTVGYGGPINVSFDWYATTQGEGKLQVEYTTNGGTTWTNVPVNVPAADLSSVTAHTNSSSPNTVVGSYVQISGQNWAPNLSVSITDPAAANNPNFAIELVNASTGADCVNTAGAALNNSSGNWRFDNINISAYKQYTPGNLVVLQAGDGVASYNAQAPLFLNEIGTTTAQTSLIAITGTTADSMGNVTVTTGPGTQNFSVGQYVQVSGVQVGSTINSAYNGVFAVASVNNAGNMFTYADPAAAGLAAGTPAPLTSGASGGAWAYAVVQQDSIPAVTGAGAQAGNQPITIDLSAAAGNGQLNRSADGGALSFDGIDSTVNNGGLTSPSTPTGQNNRVVAVLAGNPGTALATTTPNTPSLTSSFYNSTTQGAFYVGDDNRGSVAATPVGPIWTAGHPNQAGGAVSQGIHYFPTEGPSPGTQASASTNIRGITIGFDGRVYGSTASMTAGATILNTAGIFTEAQAQPTGPTPANDIQVVPALFGASKLGGIYVADVNGDGIVDNGDRLYFVDDGTVGHAGTGGIYVSVWNDAITWNPWNTPNNVAAAAAGFVNHWSVPVRLGDAPIQVGAGGVGQLRGITGTVLPSGVVQLYTTAYDNTATSTSSDNSLVQSWTDPNTGNAITRATESGTTVTLTFATNVAPAWLNQMIQVDGVVVTTANSNGLGGAAINAGYNGIFQVLSVSGNTLTYTDTNSGASNLAEIDNAGAADPTLTGTVIAEVNAGSDNITNTSSPGYFGDVALRGVAFAPVAATNVVLSQAPTNPLNPGTAVTLTATLSNPESGVNLNGEVVTFIDQNTNTILGQATVGASVSNEAILTLPSGVSGNHYVQAYFAGGGVQALAPARSNTIQIIEDGDYDTLTVLTSNLSAAAVGKQVTLTATVTTDVAGDHGATGTVSFYLGSVTPANLLGTSSLNATTGIATLNTAFATAGTDTVIAIYNGSNQYESGEQSNIPVTINVAANATATFSSSANNVALNATPTYTVSVAGNSTVGNPAGSVIFTLTSATTGAVIGTSSAIALTGSGNTTTATWSNAPALSQPGSYFVTLSYTPSGTSGYNAFTVDTTGSTSGTAFVETVKQAFTPGNLVAVQRGDGNINLGSSGYLVFLDEYTTSGTLVQRIALPNLDAGTTHALLLSGQNGGEGLLNRSANGAYLTVAGYDVPVGRTFLTSTFPYQFPRTIALVDGTGGVNTTTAIGVANPTGSGVPASIKSATATGTGTGQTVTITLNSSNFFMAGQTVTISGITDGTSGTAYDGTFTITAASGTTLSYVDPNNISSTSPTVSSATAASPASVPYNPTDVVSYDGSQFYLGSNLPVGDTTDSGILYVGSVGATTATQIGPVNTGSASIGIAGGQLYNTTGGGHTTAVGTGLPTTIGQTLTPLPAFSQNYNLFYPGKENAEEVLLLNTADGSTNNPNVAYVADQANGLLKFWLNTPATISTLSDDGTGLVTVTTTAANTLVSGQFVQITGASDATFNGTFLITVTDNMHFTYQRTSGAVATATGGTAAQWVYGGFDTSTGMYDGTFGAKLISAGGVTAVTGYVVNPGTATAKIQLYVTGVNVQQANPNQIDAYLDTNGAAPLSGTTGVDQGFGFNGTSPNRVFTNLAFVGGAPTTNPTSPNANMNFSGLAFVPGYATSTAVAVTGNATAGYSVTATVTDPTGGANVPTGAVYFYLDGSSTPYGSALLNGGVATLTIAAGALSGEHSFTAVYQGDVKDDQSTGVSGQAFGAGNLIATVGTVGSNANATATSVSEFQTTGGAAVQTIYLPTSGAGELTLKGTNPVVSGVTIPEGLVSDSADGHTASLAGYLVDAGASTSGAASAIALLQANGSVSTATQIASSDIGGSVKAAISADGLGFWVAGSNYLRYVPFGNSASTPSVLVSNYYPGANTVEIQPGNGQTGTAAQAGQIYITGAAGSPGGGLSSIDGPAQVLGGLATVAGQAETTLGNGGGTDFNTGRDAFGNFPATGQIAVSPNGRTIFVADSRTDSLGGILEYYDTLGSGQWNLVGQAQVDATADGGLQGLVVDFSNVSAPIIYATTTAASGNRIVEITGGTTNGSAPSFVFTTVETAAAGTAFRGVAFAPQAAGTATSTTMAQVTTTPPGTYADSTTNVVLSATVTGSGPTPTGYVSFQTSTGVEIGSAPLVNGTATLAPVSDLLVAQSGTITAVYTGDSFYASSSDNSQMATVAQEATTTTVSAQFATVTTTTSDTFTAQVTFTGSNAVLTGTVQFWRDATSTGAGGTKIGSAVNLTPTIVNGVLEFLATASGTLPSAGSPHNIFAVYTGDNNFVGSQNAAGSPAVTVVVAPTITVATSNANPGNNGASVMETVTVSGSGGTPTGYVQFYDNLLPIGSPVMLSGGTASVGLTTAVLQGTDTNGNQFLLPGIQSITAVYSGDGTYFQGMGVYQQAVQTNAFGVGDKFVQRIGDGITSLNAPTGSTVQGAIGSTIYIDEITTAGTIVQSIILPANDGTGTQNTIHAIVGNGQQSTTEQMTVDGANSALWLTGYDTNPLLGVTVSTTGVVSGQGTLAPGIPTVSGSIIRAIARVTTAGAVADETFTKGNSGSGFGNFNAVFSPDGNQFYLAGDGDMTYFANFTPSSSTVSPTATIDTTQTGTVTALETEAGNLVMVSPPGFGNDGPQVFSGFPTSAQSASNLPGFSDAAALAGGQASTFFVDAYFTHLDNTAGPGGTSTAPVGINTFYLSDDGPSFAMGAITKWSLVDGTWMVTDHITAPGAAPNPISYYYISGQTLSEGPGSSAVGNVTLYVTYGNGGNADPGPGQLFSITDDSGYDAVGLTDPIIYQTGTSSNMVYRGVASFSMTDLSGSGMPVTATQNTPATNVQVATFVDSDITTMAAAMAEVGTYSVSINWGDGTATSAGTVSIVSTSGSGTTFAVTGTHTYTVPTASGHSYAVHVTINDPDQPTALLLSTTATVAYATTPFNVLTGTGTPIINKLINVSFTSQVGTFTDVIPFGGSANPVSDYTAMITWGDGTAASVGTITLGSANGNVQTYIVTGTHAYGVSTAPGAAFPVSFTITSSLGNANPLTVNTTAKVLDAFDTGDLTGTGVNVSANATQSFSGPVATFTDPAQYGGTAEPANSYLVTINWGDGSPLDTTSGVVTITNNTTGAYSVAGTHTYATSGSFTVTTTVMEIASPEMATMMSTATVTSSSIMTSTTITDLGPNPSLNFGSTVQAVPFLVHVTSTSGSVTGDMVSLSDNGVAISGATGTLDASGNATITLSSAAVLTVGTHPISANFAAQGSFGPSASGPVNQVVTSTFQVNSATVSGNYVQLVFDGPIDPNTTQLFYSPGATAVAPDVTLTGPSGSVKGSLLIDATHPNVATFVATAGELAPGNYTVAVTNSVKAVGGATLASNYSQALTVASPVLTPVVTAAFVARGPGQTVNIPNSSTGLPITLSGITSAVQSLSFTLTYDPTLLSVTAATLSTDAASNGNLVLNPISFTSIDAHHMLITFTIVGGSGGGHWNPTGGTGTLLTLTATVPQNAPYTDKALLATQSVVLNGTAAQGDDAIDVNAYQGDIDGSHTYTGLDASLIDRVSVGQGTGFSVFKDLDPWIIGSVTASGTLGVTGLDAADVDKAAVGSFPSVIPQPPTGFTITGPLGPDPRLYLAAATGGDGQTVTVQERFNVSGADPSTEIDAIDSVIEYDPSKFTVSNIRAGSLLPGFSVTTNVDAVHGVIRVSEFTANPAQAPNPTDGDVLLLDFTVNSSAPLGPSPLKLAASYTDANNTSTTTAVYNATSALTLGPAPQNPSTLPLSGSTVSPFVTNVDNYFSVVGHSGTEGFPANTTATAGGTVTIPINFSNGPVPFNIAAVDNAIKFNPLLLQVTNVTVGSLLTGFSLTTNVDNTNGVLRTSEFTANEAAVSGGQVGAVLQITFAVNGSASGSIPLYILQSYTDSNNTTTTTAVYDDNGAITLTPAPQGTGSNPVFVTGVDGNLNIVVQPNQPPYASLPVPAVIPEALFNPAAHAGLQTVTPNTVAFSSATGDAIIVTDSDYTASGSPETTTLTLTGSPAGTSSGPVGTLTAAASGQAMVSGGGTQPLVITGSPSDITNTLSSLVYTPGPGFFGTATLTVSTTDNGNSGYGGSLTDVRSTSITVVGLFLSEIDTLKGNTTNPSQYIEVFSTVPSYTIPPGVYLTGINGVSGSTPAAGVVADIFNLSGFTTGSNGYLALLQKNEKYSSGGFEVAGGNQLDNSGTGVGFGSGNTSKFGTVTGVHTGSTRPSGQLATDILTGAESFLLIQTPTAPTTTTNIDPANTGNPSNQTSAYNGWNVLDSVGILDSASTSHAYAAITFKPTGATGTTLAGSNVVNTGTWVANYVGRIAQNTGSSGADWLGSVVTGTPSSGMFFLGSPNSTAFAGQPLNSIGGPNDWAPQLTVAVNDDSSNQHSQVAELTLTFSTPVNIVDLASDFVLKDASGNPLSINVSDPGTGATTEGASGPVPDSGATQLFVTFNADATHTFNFITPYLDQFGNTLTVGLVDGNYFLNTKVADISAASNSAVLLDGAKNGMSGSTTSGTGNLNGNGVNQVDEFWRLFGDTEGRRQVDGVDTTNFRTVNGVTQETSGMTAGITAASESNNTVTITTNGPSGFLMGEIVNIVGLPAGYNGSFVILSVNGNTFTYMAPTSGLTAVTNPTGAAATLNSYQWYLDYNEDGNIDVGNTLDQTQLINRLFTQLPA